MTYSIPMRKANERKTEFWTMVAIVISVIVLAVTFWLVANWSKQYQAEISKSVIINEAL